MAHKIAPPSGDVEVIHQYHCKGLYPRWERLADDEVADAKLQGFEVRELVDRAHVTRLQAEHQGDLAGAQAMLETAYAERDALKAKVERVQSELGKRTMTVSMLYGDIDFLQAELTKARGQHAKLSERAWRVIQDQIDGAHVHPCDEHSEEVKVRTLAPIYQELYATLSHQSAPVAKDGV